MVASYSPHREGGGTLHFPSPTHCHNVDPLAALSHLRRSLSRSPSRGPTFRLVTSKSTSPSPSSPLSPSPLSSHNRLSSANILSNSPSVPASPLAIPYPPSAKKSRPNRRLSPMRMSPRSLIAPRSPARRVLHESPNNGNSTPPSSMGLTLGVENQDCQNFGMVERSEQQMQSKSGNSHSEGFLAPIHARNRRDRNSGYFADITAKSSPLKRSDGVMNLDMSPSGSPSAKRRSLHGASFGADFNIFDYASTFEQPQSDKSPTDSPAPDASVQFDSPGAQSPLPRRTSSLRRTTLQQRYDKPTANKTRANHDFALDMQSPAHGSSRNRQRMSLNNVFPTPNRDSPFSSQGLPSASVHPMSTTRRETMVLAPPLLPQRHPLSRTITQSSSGSSLAEDSPTHVPFRNPEFKRPLVDFSKSLPIGALRPSFNDPSSSEASQASSFATPDNYKLAKPLPTAFMSTGLISKRNKNLDDNQMDFNESVGHMPDTPCKRPVSMASIGAIPTPEVNFNKSRQGRHTMHSFGTPSTPFNPQSSHPSVGGLGKGVSIFGSGFGVGTHSRRGSFLSVDGDDNSQSPSNKIQSQSSAEFEIPPTPTKQVPSTPLVQHSDGFGQGGPLSSPYIAANDETEREVSSNTPASSPLYERYDRRSPHTPSESMVPPDPSGLSISARAESVLVPLNDTVARASLFPPATPTANRDSFGRFSNRRLSVTPVHTAPVDVDTTITARFDKFEIIGTGEFSHVYRVSRKAEPTTSQGYFSVQGTRSSPRTPLPDQVWAVKKSRNPYIGPRDRKQKLKEVEILKALGHSDHTINIADSWENNDHLYIQTEYCEEGSLDRFLNNVGRDARLDDFRIWKILLELSLGLQHIHDSGIIHLDLKPANILITFEGVLKIADFGMATSWPAQPGIEGEGDREYIGPEILMGQFDKPADVFAFGLIMLEIAGNVVLPDNGVSWQRLRTGDMTDVPSLTSSSQASTISRDSSGKPLPLSANFFGDIYRSDTDVARFSTGSFTPKSYTKFSSTSGVKSCELQIPPAYMIDPNHEQALDRIVRWMISPNPADRPVVSQLLAVDGVQWAASRRRAGATIWEGNWGPADEVLQDDAEMIDV